MATERIRLTMDLDALLPGEEFRIGTQSITIRPLSVSQYRLIFGKIKSLMDYLKEKGIDGTNYQKQENFLVVAEVILEKFPELLEEISNIAVEDLQQLPIDIIVPLIGACLDVNLKSKESLLGNFKSLAGKMSLLGLTEKTAAKKQASQK